MKSVSRRVDGELIHPSGTIVGKALKAHDHGSSVIEVLVFAS
jgi:hypothetical protein